MEDEMLRRPWGEERGLHTEGAANYKYTELYWESWLVGKGEKVCQRQGKSERQEKGLKDEQLIVKEIATGQGGITYE